MGQDNIGFYDLSQLASCRKTEKQREHIGILPLSKKQIGRLLDAGKFPAPAGRMFGRLVWRKEDILSFIEKIEIVLEKEGDFKK